MHATNAIRIFKHIFLHIPLSLSHTDYSHENVHCSTIVMIICSLNNVRFGTLFILFKLKISGFLVISTTFRYTDYWYSGFHFPEKLMCYIYSYKATGRLKYIVKLSSFLHNAKLSYETFQTDERLNIRLTNQNQLRFLYNEYVT